MTLSFGSVLCSRATLGLCTLLVVEPALAADPTLASEPVSDPAPEASPAPRVDPTPLVSTDLPPALVWRWSRFTSTDYALTVAGGALTLAAAILHPRAKHSLSGGLWFDDDVRNALRAHTLNSRYDFRDASDVGLSLMISWPLVADSLTTAWWYRGSRDVAEQTALIDLETLAVSGAIQGITNGLVSRERPYGRDCGSASLPSDAIDCANSVHYRSFFSGHSTFSFTGAALICTNHFEIGLLGSPWDGLSCAGAYAIASTTATFRVVADVHYASDVLTGALVGTLVGYGVPFLHYRIKAAPAATSDGLQLHLVPSPGGIGLLGIF